jgi:aldose sugar dehydrogenase
VQRVRFESTTFVEQERLVGELRQRIRAVSTGPDGLIYLLVDASSAPLLRLQPEG